MGLTVATTFFASRFHLR